MTRINLLPWRARRRERRKRTFFCQAAAAFAGVVALLAAVGAAFDGRIEYQQRRNQFLESELAALDARIAQIQGLRREREEIHGRMQLLDQLGSERDTLVRVLDGIARTLAPGVFYTAIAKRATVITGLGAAESNAGVATLMRNLGASESFAAPNLKSIAEADGAGDGESVTTFELTFEVVPPALVRGAR